MVHPIRKESEQSNENQEVQGFDDVKKSFKVPKIIKLLGGTALGLVILAGVGGAVATQVIDQQKYKSLIVSKVEEASGYTIDWDGNIALGFMPLPHATVNNLSVKLGDAQILSIEKADVQVKLSSLLSQKIDVRSVTLNKPVVTLTTSKNGDALYLAKTEKADENTVNETVSEGSKSPMEVMVNRVDITDGTFIIDNQQSGSKQQFDKLNISLHADGLSGPFDVTGNTEWSGQKVEVKATTGEINMTEGRYPVQAEIALPNVGAVLTFSGVVDGNNKGAEGDITLDADNISSAVKSFTGSAPNLPKGLDGKGNLAGKLVYATNRMAMDDMTVTAGDVGFRGALSAEGLADGATPQLSFDLKPTSQAKNNADQLIRILSDLNITAKGTMDGNTIKISSAHIKTLGNDVSISGTATTGATPTVNLVINADKINLDNLNGGASATSSSSGAGTSAPSAKNMGFAVPFAGRVRADVNALTTGGQTYSNIKADVVSSGKSLTISNASLNSPQDASIAVSGKIGNTTDLSGLDLKVNAKTSDAEKLMAAYKVTPPNLPKKIGAASVDGTFSGDLQKLNFAATVSALKFNASGQGSVATPLETPQISSLAFKVKHPSFAEAIRTFQPGFDTSSSMYAGALDIAGNASWAGNTYTVKELSGDLGKISLTGNISATTQPKMNITGNLDFGNIIMPSATKSGGGAVGNSASSSSADRWSRETIDTAWMRSMDADLKIRAKSFQQDKWVFNNVNLAFRLKDGTLNLDDVSAGMFGGKAAINGVLKSGAGAKDPLSVSGNLTSSNVDAAGLMSAATGKVSHTISGNLSNVDVSVNAMGASPYALVQTLGGKGAIAGKNIIVQGIDAAQLADAARGSYKPLERAGSLFKSFQNGQTEFTDFNTDFAIQSGVVNFSKILFDGPKATLSSTGNVNLPAWTVDLKNSMVVKNTDIPPFDFAIRGPLDKPINSGGDVVNNYLRSKFEKKATDFIEKKLGGKLDKFLGGGASGTTDTPTGDDTDAAPTTQPSIEQEAAKEAVKALQGLFGR